MKKRIIAVFLAVLMGTSVTACSGQNETQEINRVSVSGMFPETGDVIVTNTYIGTVAPKESIIVYPMASGNVTEVSATVGQQVKQGDVLFKLDSKLVDQEISEAEENLEKAEKLAEQAKEDAEALEEALAKVETAEEKADLEVQVEAKEKKVAEYKTAYEAAKKDYEELEADYNKYKYTSSSSSSKMWTKDETEAREDELALAKKYMNLQKSIYDTADSELTALKKALTEASKSTSSSSTSSSTSTSKSTTSSSASTSKSTTSSTNDSKTSDSDTSDDSKKSTDSKTDDDTKTTDTKTSDSTATGNTVYDQMVEDAEKSVEKAKAKLELYQVTAPIDGTVEAVYVEANEKAFDNEPCLIISNKSNIEVTFQVAEAAALALNTGDKVKVEKNGAMNEATITEVAVMADPQTKLFTVKASLGAVTDFSTGTDVKVYAETKKALNVMRLPYDVLYFQGDTAYVYCAVDEEAVRIPVQVGLMNDDYAQILDGLTEEDIVISTWSSQLKDGADIDLLFVIGGNTVDINADDAEDTENTEDTEDTTEGLVDDTLDSAEDQSSDDAEGTEEEYQWVLPDMD